MQKFKVFGFLIMLIALFEVANAQNAIISVRDDDSKQAISYANLCFQGLVSDSKSYSITSLTGEVENTLDEKSLLIISFIGYESLIDTIWPGESKSYQLKADLFNLNQVIITATRTEKALKDVPAITQLVTAKEIENRGITSISTVLEDDVPGIEFHQAGFGSDIKMQGLDANYVLFLVDGERMAGETEGNIDYNRLNMNDVERIEIVKGASSALYGSQAMGGVINIITKKPRDKVEFNFGAKYQQFNQINYADLKNDDDFYTYKKNLDKPNLNSHATLGFYVGKLMSKTNFNIKSTDAYILQSSDSMVMDIIEYDTTITKLTTTEVPGTSDFTISQMFEYKIGEKWKLRTNASYYKHNQYDFIKDKKYQQFEDFNYGFKAFYQYTQDNNLEFSYQDDLYKKYDVSEKTNNRNQEYAHHFYNPKVIINHLFGESHLITGGLEYLGEHLSTKMFSGDIDSLVTKEGATGIAFIQDDYTINSKLSMIAGLRYDHHSVFGGKLSPKVSVMYKWIPFTFRVNYAQGFRTPTLKELYMDWDHIGIFYIHGNENLLPETNNYISGSVEYTKSKFNGSVNVYKNWFKNRIDGYWSIADDGKEVYNYTNIDDSKITGIELLLKYKLSKHFMISGGYSYIDDQQTLDNINISSVAPHSGNFKVGYSLTKRVYDLNINFSGKITGEKNYYEATDISISGQQNVGTYAAHYSAFSLWKLTVAQNFHNGINLVLGVNNIFDYKTPIINFNTSLSPGRRFFVSLNFSVDKLYREFSAL